MFGNLPDDVSNEEQHKTAVNAAAAGGNIPMSSSVASSCFAQSRPEAGCCVVARV